MRTWQVERRKRTRHLIELGGLVVKAGVVDLTGDERATIFGASMRDFRVVMIVDAVSGVYDRGVAELNAIGVSTPSAEAYLAEMACSCGRQMA